MDIKLIEEKQNKLKEVSNILKDKFIGIDNVIDRIIDSISLWYIMPELQLRPPIIALWGITGIGKTDLIRTLVKHLGFNDKFIEIQMDDIDRHYNNTIEEHLESGGIEPNEPAVLLLDEIQRYRTVDERGMTVKNKSYNDIWTLLSDGKFQNNAKRKYDLLELFYDELYDEDREKNGGNEEKEINSSNTVEEVDVPSNTKSRKQREKDFKYQLSFWSAKRLKKILKVSTPINELMKLKTQEKIELIKSTLNDSDVTVGSNYNKLLIVVSGNLDEAFEMAFNVSDVDSDADIYHENSKDINIIDIKNALTVKFKPEQIARFGNNHIIYPLLSKQNYIDIIKKYSDEILDKILNDHNIKINLSNNVYKIMYTNGVFPTQGVRPTISTIYSILGSNLPHFIFKAILNGINEINIDYDKKKNVLYANIKDEYVSKIIILDIDNIKNNKSIDEKSLVLVHELGHALVYAELFKSPPKQINVNSIGFSSGFISTHQGIDNKTDIKNKLTVMLAGMVSEEIVYGDEYKSTGCSGDLMKATTLASKFVRKYNMDGSVSRIEREAAIEDGVESNYDISHSNQTIENLLVEEKKRATDIINNNIHILKKLITFTLNNKSKININDFVNICNENGMNINIPDNNHIVYDYDDKLKKFLINND